MDSLRLELSALTKNLKQARVLVVGDLMLDHYIYGDVHRKAPEADVPVLSAAHENFIPGGAAGVVANIAGTRGPHTRHGHGR